MAILDGKKLAEKIKVELKKKVSALKQKPVLAMVLVGRNPASEIYLKNKRNYCTKVGIKTKIISLPLKISKSEIIKTIEKLNHDKNITAIIVQLPLPKHIQTIQIISRINPKKDADCLHPLNFGKFMQGENQSLVAPATPSGIIKLLEEYKISISGKNAVVIGRSNIVGKPVAQMLMNRGATVTICHSLTKNLNKHTRNAEILIVAVGKKGLIKSNMVKKGVAIIDVGVNRSNNKISGDVDFVPVSKKAAFITPVPGGVGPLTVAMLTHNIIKLAE